MSLYLGSQKVGANIQTGGGAQIDDTTASSSTVYSSSKCNNTYVSSTTIRSIVQCTQAQYDSMVSEGTLDANTFYIITGSSS